MDGERLERQIIGALRSAIDAHGPVTPERIGSAAKRIRRQIEAEHQREPLRVNMGQVTASWADPLGGPDETAAHAYGQ